MEEQIDHSMAAKETNRDDQGHLSGPWTSSLEVGKVFRIFEGLALLSVVEHYSS